MNQIFSAFLVIVAIISFYEVFTHNDEDSKGEKLNSENEFNEFEDDEFQKRNYEIDKDSVDNENLEIRSPQGDGDGNTLHKMPINFPPVKFMFCVSCGYRQAFDQFSQILREKYPGIQIIGENYPPSTMRSIIAQIFGFGKIALIVTIVMGRDPFQSAGFQTPSFYTWMLNNKFSACLMLFLLSNSVESMMMSTGAFEIYLENENIWSKLESGRVPTPAELFQAIEANLALHSGIKGSLNNAGFSFDENQ